MLNIDRYKIYFYQLFIFLNDGVDLADDAIVDRRQIKENPVPIERVWNVVIDNNTKDLDINFLFLINPMRLIRSFLNDKVNFCLALSISF